MRENFLANPHFWSRSQTLPSLLSVSLQKQASTKKSYMLGLYIFTFMYVQCSNVTRLHHLKKKKERKTLDISIAVQVHW